jgi:hypothetical protein
MVYEDKKKNDKIASSTGKDGFADGKRLLAAILTSLFTETLYTASVVRDFSIAAVSQNRLSWYYTNAQRLLGFTQGSGIKEYSALFDPLLCRATPVKKRAFEKLLASIFNQAYQLKLIEDCPTAAIDATGLETRYTSQHFIRCKRRESFYRRRWPKLTIVCEIKTHLIAGCRVTRGPSMDFPNLQKAIEQAEKYVHFDMVLADAGYDSEFNHTFCRDKLNIRSTIIAYNPRRTTKLPSAKYRREMATKFERLAYGQRWQVESVFSRHKRLLGSALRNRNAESRKRECLLRVLTHNLMIIRRAA